MKFPNPTQFLFPERRIGSILTLTNIKEDNREAPLTEPCGLGFFHKKSGVDTPNFLPQADEGGNMQVTTESDTTHQIVTFKDGSEDHIYSMDDTHDPTTMMSFKATDNSLERFFERPIKYPSIIWGVGANISTSFNPWLFFTTDKRVVNRISNYNLMRCKLHVKFMINGNSFHFGRAIASYLPYPTEDSVINTLSKETYLLQLSQLPHVYLDPTTNQGGTLELPFIYPYNAANVANGDIHDLGQIYIESFSALRHANGATDNVTITPYVWATDVQLSVVTSDNASGMKPQSDEYAPISKPAEATAKLFARLTDVPIIGPYARASEMAARTTAGIAKLFGYSRPAVIRDRGEMVPKYCGSMSYTNTGDTTAKLALDAKNEVTIDPRVVGLAGVDEMDFRSIVQRESYLNQFQWSVSDATGTQLWWGSVEPAYNSSTPTGMIPAMWVAEPFEYWRGTVTYRFQVVSSGFHRGRIAICWDPSNLTFAEDSNVAYTHILDLASERETTVTIGWGQSPGYLPTSNLGKVFFNTTSFGLATYGNGAIGVYVVNDLTVANSVAGVDPVTILVSVKFHDDFEVAVPKSINPNATTGKFYIPQSLENDTCGMDVQPLMASSDVVFNPSAPADGLAQIHMGEVVSSWRQLLKRYCLSRACTYGSGTGVNVTCIAQIDMPEFPLYPGNAVDGVDTTGVLGTVNYTTMTLLNWATPAYLCRRGAIRRKCQFVFTDETTTGRSTLHQVSGVTRTTKSAVPYTASVFQLPAATQSAAAYNLLTTGSDLFSGSEWQYLTGNNYLEYEIPYYNVRRFINGRSLDRPSTNHGVLASLRTQEHDTLIVNEFVAAADDFSLSFFLCTPAVHTYTLAAA